MDASGNGFLKAVSDYVHLNPMRAPLWERFGAMSSVGMGCGGEAGVAFGISIQPSVENLAKPL